MTGYVRVDTSNNIADGNVISAADLDNEFDGVQAGFNASTGHTHGGTAGEGAPITKIGPTQDVTASASLLAPKTTNTVDVGSSLLKFKDLWLAGNANFAGTTTLGGALTYGGVTLSNAVTGTGNMVLSTSPTLVTPVLGTPASGTVTNLTGTASININGTVGATTANTGAFTTLSASSTVSGTGFSTYLASPPAIGGTAAAAGAFTTLSASSTVTLSGGTANGVAYLNGSKVLTTGSALTFDGTNLGIGATSVAAKLHVQSSVGNNGADNTGMLLVESTFASNAGNANTSIVAKNYYGNLQFMQWQNFGARIGSRVTANGGAGEVAFTYGNDSEGMRLTSTGLGIGTSSPMTKLDVVGVIQSKGNALSVTDVNGTNPFFINRENTTTGNLQFRYSSTSLMELTQSGNLGLGVTPSAWGLAGIFQFRNGTLFNNTLNDTYLGTNFFFDGSGDKYITNDFALQYALENGNFVWRTAPSGTAGNAITFTQAMTLDASGNLGVGTTSPGVKLDVRGTSNTAASTIQIVGNTVSSLLLGQNADGGVVRGQGGNNALTFWTGGSGDTGAGQSGSERARIDSSGNLIQTVNTTAATLATNGTLTFSIVDNSTLRISVRGSDGTTRTATVALT
jgi:hypothetical protein